MAIVCGTTAADFEAIDREDYADGMAWFASDRGYVSGASAAWRCGWLYAHHRYFVGAFFRGRHNAGCQTNNRSWLRHHLEMTRKYRWEVQP